MKLEIYEKEIIEVKYFRKFNMVTIKLIDLRGKWLVTGNLWGFEQVWWLWELKGKDGFERKKEDSLGVEDRWNVGAWREGRHENYDLSINFTVF